MIVSTAAPAGHSCSQESGAHKPLRDFVATFLKQRVVYSSPPAARVFRWMDDSLNRVAAEPEAEAGGYDSEVDVADEVQLDAKEAEPKAQPTRSASSDQLGGQMGSAITRSLAQSVGDSLMQQQHMSLWCVPVSLWLKEKGINVSEMEPLRLVSSCTGLCAEVMVLQAARA